MKKIIKKIKRWLGYFNGKTTVYTGGGFIQGLGFDVEADIFEIRRLGIRIVKNIVFDVDSEWLRKLKKRIIEDGKQQLRESSNPQ